MSTKAQSFAQSQIDRAERDLERARVQAGRVSAIANAFPEIPNRVAFIHSSTLYDTAGSVSIDNPDPDYNWRGRPLSCADLLTLLELLPPVELECRRGACTTIQSSDYEDPKYSDAQIVHMGAIYWTHEPSQYQDKPLKVHWTAQLSPDLRVRISAPVDQCPGRLNVVWDYLPDRYGGGVSGILSKTRKEDPGVHGWNYSGGSHTDPGRAVFHFSNTQCALDWVRSHAQA